MDYLEQSVFLYSYGHLFRKGEVLIPPYKMEAAHHMFEYNQMLLAGE